jgi:hypothetical protein
VREVRAAATLLATGGFRVIELRTTLHRPAGA